MTGSNANISLCKKICLAMLFLTIPVFYPVIADAGIDPIWFGIFAVIVVEFGSSFRTSLLISLQLINETNKIKKSLVDLFKITWFSDKIDD